MLKKCKDLHQSVKVCYPKSAGRGNWSSRFPCCLQKTQEDPIKEVFHITDVNLCPRSKCYYK